MYFLGECLFIGFGSLDILMSYKLFKRLVYVALLYTRHHQLLFFCDSGALILVGDIIAGGIPYPHLRIFLLGSIYFFGYLDSSFFHVLRMFTRYLIAGIVFCS